MKTKTTRDLTYKQRLLLSDYLKASFHKKHIAELLGVCLATVYNEIKRGSINGVYNPNFSQKKYENLKKVRGKRETLYIDKELAQQIANLILKENLSPEKVIIRLKEQNIDCPTKTTIYLAIDRGLIPNVKREDLHSKTTTMFSHGLIQIPAWIREKLDLKDGDLVKIAIQNESIVLEKNRNV